MYEVETSIDPPETDEGGGGDEQETSVYVNLHEPDGTIRTASALLMSTDDPEVADALLRCLRSIAAHRGPGLQVAIQQAIGELP